MGYGTKRNLLTNQLELSERIRSHAVINLVTCGDCGSVILHDLSVEMLSCPYCLASGPVSDFPDFIYESMVDDLAPQKDPEFLVVPELGCGYRMMDGMLETCPMNKDGSLDEGNWYPVEETLVGDEIVTYHGKEVTFSEVYKELRERLSR